MKHMDHSRTSGAAGVSELPAAACSEMAIRGDGDVPAAEPGGCFDCNICLDSAADPVVTLCGHLYCWPCIYEWLRPESHDDAESRSSASARPQCCPVCKAAVTPDALVPLYGRGSRATRPTKAPRRPAVRQSVQESGGHHHYRNVQTGRPATPGPRHHAGAPEFDLLFPPPFGDRGSMTMQYSSTAGGLAMALLPWARRRDRGQPPSMYFPSPYHLSPSQRRRQMEVETSLRQIWSFLFAIVLLCFLLF